ncbi:MAG: response regulator transcription factor [Nakamurella sp.]
MTDTRTIVLVVDDDPTVRDVARRYLERDGHRVVEAAAGDVALTLATEHRPDLIVLDLMLPGLSGLEVCRRVRLSSTVPIIMLTARGTESDRIAGLEHGADDYVVKPFSPRELALRVSRILDRARPTGQPAPTDRPRILEDGDLWLDEGARVARRAGRTLALTSREFDLLVFLVRHPGQVYSRSALMEQVWQWTFGDQSTVTVHVRRLREKIESEPARPVRVATVWGQGYRYDPTPVPS